MESTHAGAIAAVTPEGTLVASSGDVDRIFFLRSAAKPFQATVSQELGADLVPEQMAVACASHRGHPVHVAIVKSMLAGVGLDESALQCPPSWPSSAEARDRVVAAGYQHPERVWHNCSGKHAAMLRACVAREWPVETYLDPEHPLQRRTFELMTEVVGHDPGPVGVDGCGAPVFRGSVGSLARAYAMLGSQDRFTYAWDAMHRYPALTYDQGLAPSLIATWLDAAAKVGAEGSLGVSIRGQMGLAVKSWDGSSRPTGPAMVALLDHLGFLGPDITRALESVAAVPVLGEGRTVGSVVARENWA
ncbi:MAG: asparaginase [Gammaproteobacteria bacterium]|nr:asparaginase [Gammaproteobacteria bacterium]